MPSLFPQPEGFVPLAGIARLAAQGETVAQGHQVQYITLENRSLLSRCDSPRMPFRWMINPYRGCEFACKYCYARYTHEFMELRDSLDFERRIYVKQHAGWLLRQELKKVRAGESIAIGTATDPYQPAERKFGITRAILEEFARHEGLSIGLTTKSTLVLRDLDLLQAVSAKNRLTVCVTVTTTDERLARILEPRAPRPDLRMDAVRSLVVAGVRAGVNCAPVLPRITDAPRDLETLVRAAAAARAAFVYANTLFLKPCSARVFLPFVEQNFPQLVEFYRERYASRAFLPAHYARRISQLIHRYAAKFGLPGRELRPLSSDGPRLPHSASAQEQLQLFQEARRSASWQPAPKTRIKRAK